MARENVSVRVNSNIVIAAAAAAQALYRTRSLIEVHHKVEEVELILRAVRHCFAQPVVLLEDTRKVFFGERIRLVFIGNDRLRRKLLKAQSAHMQHVLGEIEIVFCERSADIIIRSAGIRSAIHQLLELRDYHVVSALSVKCFAYPVGGFAPTVKGKHDVHHFAVYVVYLLVVEQYAVCRYRKAEVLSVLLLYRTRVVHRFNNGVPRHKRLAAKEIKLDVFAVCGLFYQKVDSLAPYLRRHYAALAAEIAGLRKAVFAAQIAVVRHVQAHRFHGAFHHSFRILFVIVLREKLTVFIQRVQLTVCFTDILRGVLRELFGKLRWHFLRHRRAYEVQHIESAVVHNVDGVAVAVYYDIISQLLKLMNHNLPQAQNNRARNPAQKHFYLMLSHF